ncbi:fibronectin type III domain-containing protein [Catenulispora yoronensis]
MRMPPRRTRRRSTPAAIAAGILLTATTVLAAMIAAPAAEAIGNGFDPHTAQVVVPGTSTVVTEWKLAGQGFAQGVQIAPQWILASGHAAPQAGGTFTDEYGSAKIDRIAGNCLGGGHGLCDVSVAHLATPIPAPAFPPLLLDGVPNPQGSTIAGDTLAVGNGGSTTGRPTVGWTQPTRYNLDLSVLQSGLSSINGDSGGPSFYYYPGHSTGVLQGIATASAYGIVGGLQQFSADTVKPFLDGVLPPGTVTWTTFGQLGPTPLVPEPVAQPTVTSNYRSITVSWPAVTATPPVTGYRAVLVNTGDVRDTTVIATDANTHTAVFDGLTLGAPYGVFVLAANANGESKVPWATMGGVPPATPAATWSTTAAASFQPPRPKGGAVSLDGPGQLNFTVTPTDVPIPGVTKYEVLVDQCAGSCGLGQFTQVSDQIYTNPSGTVWLPTSTPLGTQFQTQIREINSSGKSPWIYRPLTYVPKDRPLAPTAVTVTPQADGGTKVSWTPAAADPQPAVLTGYKPHAQPISYVVEVNIPGQGTVTADIVDPSQTTDTFNIADLGGAPSTYTLDVEALSGWGYSLPASVTAPMGVLPAPPPVTATRTPAAPPAPANLTVPTVSGVGATNTVTWTQPASGPGVASVDEYLITLEIQDPESTLLPIVAEVPANQLSYTYQNPYPSFYKVTVYGLSQQAGASVPAIATGTIANP